MRRLTMSNSFALLLLTLSATSQALEFKCNGASCKCSSTIGIGFAQGTDGSGAVPNFEIAVPHTGGGFSAYYRNNFIADTEHVKNHSWFGPKTVSNGDINGISLLENAVYNPAKNPFVPGNGNLEVMAIKDNNLYHYWRERDTKDWSSGSLIASGVTGQPGFTQSKKWHENFEVVVALANGGLAHYWRDNTDPAMPWGAPLVFAQGRTYDAVALIESNFDDGNLEVIARSGETLYHMFRTGDTNWSSPIEIRVDNNIAIRAKGVHSFVQGNSGTKGNFELIVPLVTGGLGHYTRDNDNKVNNNHPWATVTNVDSARNYTSAAVIASGFNNLELIARRENDGALVAFNSNSTYDTWSRKAGNTGTPIWAGGVFGGEPCSDTKTKGRWQDPYHASAIGIHTALQPNGKVLMFGFADDNDMGDSIIFNPTNGENELPAHDHNNHNMPHAFCSGHALLSNGELWIAGGHGDDHIADSFIFNYANASWTQLPDLGPNPTADDPYGDGRWYPTLTRLESGSVLVISGSMHVGRTENPNQINSSWQILDNNHVLSAKKSVPKPFAPAVSATNSIMMYPFVYQLPQGNVLVHSERTSRIFNPSNNYWDPNFTPNTQYAYNRNYPGSGSSVMLPLSPSLNPALNYAARIMVFGGSGNVSLSGKPESDNYVPATNTVEMLDFGKSSTPSWEYKASMKHSRVLNNAVLLPDGTVFVVGGSSHGASDLAASPVMIPEIYNPANNSWTEMAPMRVARLYHSTAMLLPDGKVMTAGRDHAWNPYPYKWPERRVEIFSPPYLETTNPRPVINSVTATQSYATSYNVTLGTGVSGLNIRSATLIAPGAVTHAYDQSQRAINLEISNKTSSGLTIKTPPNGKVAPPGYYMLFLVSDQGVPSISKFIKLQKP